MDDNQRLEQIEEKMEKSAPTQGDVVFLLSLLKKKDERIALLEKKAEVLGHQLLELTSEIENVKSDFGNQR